MLLRMCHASALADGFGINLRKLSARCGHGLKIPSRGYCQKVENEAKVIAGIPYKNITIGVPREIFPKERRIALSPAATAILVKKGFNVNVEKDAGLEAKFANEDYTAAGANVKSLDEVFNSDILLKVRSPQDSEIEKLRQNGTLISFIYPAQNQELLDKLTKKNLTVFAMEAIPRISRAQVFDALSSMANISGYKAVIEAANHFGRFFTGL